MRLQSAITVFTRSISVASGVFAPGRLGELTGFSPFELVDAVLQESLAVQRRLRDLPSRVGVYFLLALNLFPHLGYAGVWSKLTCGLGGLPVPTPSETALRLLRRRVGAAPMKALFEVVAGPLTQPHTPGVRYRPFRTVAFDDCGSIKVPDSERNRGWLGRIEYRLAWAGYPTVMLMALAETGTRGLLGAAFGPATGPGSGKRRTPPNCCPCSARTCY
ncbi:transposase domain-containing protein [Streptomyces sp. NPDC005795]|uniref:transposase domain-containing protein n=1 Tax=Streptomyces sp. NPDC005795 TaxID=3154677 RepID=UPI00340B6F39